MDIPQHNIIESDYLSKLNDAQRLAVTYCGGPSLVIAGAGSGKTRVLTYKIVHLINSGVAPYRILALTFTNKAAREMKERIEPLVGASVAAQLWMGTFHSIFAKILRINSSKIGFDHNFTIYDTTDTKSLIKHIIKEMNLDEKIYKPSSIQSRISFMKNLLYSPTDYARNRDSREEDNKMQIPCFYDIFNRYCDRCRRAGAMDFDDLLYYTNVLLRDNKDVLNKYQDFFQYILVDEYQDTNFAQHLIVRQIADKNQNLCVVGDDAQSIYSFRGANISNILTLGDSFHGLKTFKLEQNYRSTQTIISAANSLIEKNKHQIAKHIFSENEVGNRIPVIECSSNYEESYVVANQIMSLRARGGYAFSDFAVLYRTNAQSRALEEAFSNGGKRDRHGNRQRSIPYRIYGGLSFYQRKEVKDALAYFRLTVNPNDDESLRRIINYPARGIGETTVNKIQACASHDRVSLWDVICNPSKHGLGVNKGTLGKLQNFKNIITGFIDFNADDNNAFVTATKIIDDTHLLAVLAGDKSAENISRQENINELIGAVHTFVEESEEEGYNAQLIDFLQQASLSTDQDQDDGNEDRVTLMTVHAAKGLEFKNVIIVGVEEDLFPSKMSSDTLAGIEEERRLMYVAITRAQDNCVITYALQRFLNGQNKVCTQSRFISDIDSQFLQQSGTRMFGESRRSIDVDLERAQFNRPITRKDHLLVRESPTASRIAANNTSHTLAAVVGAQCHTIDEVSVGTVIIHNRFGRGIITAVDDTSSSHSITVDFDNTERKKLLLKFAKFTIL